MSKDDKDDNKDEKDKKVDPLEGLSPEERAVFEQLKGDLPDELRDAIESGMGKVVMKRLDKSSPIGDSLLELVKGIVDLMSEAAARGESIEAGGPAAVEIVSRVLGLWPIYPVQIDLLLKSLVYGMSAVEQISPKEFLERLSEAAPDRPPLVSGTLVMDEEKSEAAAKAQKEIEELNKLLDLEITDDPSINTNPENKEEQ